MKILITPTNHATIHGLYQALSSLNHTILTWVPHQGSIYSILDKEKPDLIFCPNSAMSPINIEAIQHYNIPTVVFGLVDAFPSCKLICLLQDISDNIKKNVVTPLYKLNQGANLVSTYDVAPFDILYSYTNPISISYIEYLHFKERQVRIISDSRVPQPEYVGLTNSIDRASLYKAAKITILDNIDDIYNVAIHGGFALTTLDSDIYPSFHTIDELEEKLHAYLTNDKLRLNIIKKAKSIAKLNTYTHQLYDIFTLLNLNEEASQCLSKVSA